jgi:hypothetical protein
MRAAYTVRESPYFLLAKSEPAFIMMTEWLFSVFPDCNSLMTSFTVVISITIFPSVLHLLGTGFAIWLLAILASGLWASAVAAVTHVSEFGCSIATCGNL